MRWINWAVHALHTGWTTITRVQWRCRRWHIGQKCAILSVIVTVVVIICHRWICWRLLLHFVVVTAVTAVVTIVFKKYFISSSDKLILVPLSYILWTKLIFWIVIKYVICLFYPFSGPWKSSNHFYEYCKADFKMFLR